ncbi:MAG: hypothetical protein SGPRY_001349, partial [Prymnesium sp.]
MANLSELRRRVDALFACAGGRVGESHADLEEFVSRLTATANALLRERFPEQCAPQQKPLKRKRHEAMVCSGSWEKKWETVEALENGHPQPVYEEVAIQLKPFERPLVLRQFTSHFWCSGCRLWDSAVALGRYLLEHPELVCNRRVLELGCGVAPIPGLCAARVAATVSMTEGEANLLPSIRHNLEQARLLFSGFKATVE